MCLELLVQMLQRDQELLLHSFDHIICTLLGILLGSQLCLPSFSVRLVCDTLSSQLEDLLLLFSHLFHCLHCCLLWAMCRGLWPLFCQDQSPLPKTARFEYRRRKRYHDCLKRKKPDFSSKNHNDRF